MEWYVSVESPGRVVNLIISPDSLDGYDTTGFWPTLSSFKYFSERGSTNSEIVQICTEKPVFLKQNTEKNTRSFTLHISLKFSDYPFADHSPILVLEWNHNETSFIRPQWSGLSTLNECKVTKHIHKHLPRGSLTCIVLTDRYMVRWQRFPKSSEKFKTTNS